MSSNVETKATAGRKTSRYWIAGTRDTAQFIDAAYVDLLEGTGGG